MDYKKIIKSREARFKILRFLSFIPDAPMLKLQYWIKTGRKLDLKNPQRYTEKLQWYKLYYKNPLLIKCVDKWDVRAYIEEMGFGNTLIECYGVYNSVEEIDFDSLPQQFVLKNTLGGGGGENSVMIVRDKSVSDIAKIKSILTKWVQTPHGSKDGGREWPYYEGKKPRILIEKYLESDLQSGGLVDYKFFCFNGKTEFVYAAADRNGGIPGIGVYTRDFERLPYEPLGKHLKRDVRKPDNYEEMLMCAEKLSQAFPHVRVDMYSHNSKVLFGELTFYNGSGYTLFDPDEFDYILGISFNLAEIT